MYAEEMQATSRGLSHVHGQSCPRFRKKKQHANLEFHRTRHVGLCEDGPASTAIASTIIMTSAENHHAASTNTRRHQLLSE